MTTMSGRRRWIYRAAALAAAAAIGWFGLSRLALRDLRELEAHYVEGRRLTACATRELAPFAEGGSELDDLSDALLGIVTKARDQAREVRDRAADERATVPFPGLRSAEAAVVAALDAEVDLYQALVVDPNGSEDELDALGRANQAAERRLGSARRWMFADEPARWDDRFRCRR